MMPGAWDSVVDQEVGALPQGAQATNPGTWDSHVDQAIQQGPSQIKSPFLRYPLMAGSALVRGAAGVVDTPATIRDAASSLFTGGMNLLTGSNTPTPRDYFAKNAPWSNVPSAGQITNKLGLTENPHLAPQGLGENLLVGGVSAAPYAAIDLLSGGSLTPALFGNVIAGTGAEAAHQAMPDSILAPILAGFAGGYSTSRLFQARAASKEWSQLQKDLPASQQAAKDASSALEDLRDQVARGAISAKDAKSAAVNASLVDRDAFIAQANAERRLGLEAQKQSLTANADSLGNSISVEDAGAQLQNASRQWIMNDLPSKLKALWAPLDKAIPGETPASVDRFRAALDGINTQTGALEILARDLKSPIAQKWAARLKARDEMASLGPVPAITWEDLSGFRTMLGDAMSNPSVLKDIGQQNMNKLYAALTDDMRSVAKAKGVSNDFAQANAGSKSLFDKAENVFSKITDSATDTGQKLPGNVADGFLRRGAKDSSELQTLRDEIPEAADHLAAVSIRNGSWSKLSPESQAALIPDAAKRAEVTFGIKAQDDINAAAEARISDAKVNHQNNVKLAAATKETADKSGRIALLDAKSAKQAAAERAADIQARFNEMASTNKPFNLQDALHSALGGGAAYAAFAHGGKLLEEFGMPGVSPTKAAVTAGVLSYGLPKVAGAIKNTAKDIVLNPKSRRASALGAAAGSAWQPINNPFGVSQ